MWDGGGEGIEGGSEGMSEEGIGLLGPTLSNIPKCVVWLYELLQLTSTNLLYLILVSIKEGDLLVRFCSNTFHPLFLVEIYPVRWKR